jgi:LysR family transcriptional regulator for bpeEF and oprC
LFWHLPWPPSAAHPGLRVVTILANEVDSLVRRGIDLAIRLDEVETDALVARPIFRALHVVCAAPSYLRRVGTPRTPREVDPSQCLGWVLDGVARPRPWRLVRGKETHEIIPAGNLFFNSSDVLLGAAIQGARLVMVLDLLAHAHLNSGRLVPLLSDWETEAQVFYLVYPKSPFISPKLRSFVEFVTNAFPEHFRQDPQSLIRIRRRR